MQKQPALVGIVPRKSLWPLIQEQKWYHIPVESAPKNARFAEYLGFYFPKVFGEEMKYLEYSAKRAIWMWSATAKDIMFCLKL